MNNLIHLGFKQLVIQRKKMGVSKMLGESETTGYALERHAGTMLVPADQIATGTCLMLHIENYNKTQPKRKNQMCLVMIRDNAKGFRHTLRYTFVIMSKRDQFLTKSKAELELHNTDHKYFCVDNLLDYHMALEEIIEVKS